MPTNTSKKKTAASIPGSKKQHTNSTPKVHLPPFYLGELTKEEKEKLCEKLIKEAVVLKEQSFFVNTESNMIPNEIMTWRVRDQLYNLLHDREDGYQDWGQQMNEYQSLLQEILILLGKPDIVNMMREHYRKDASRKIDNLIDFFQFINEQETLALLDLESISYNLTENVLEGLINHYKFDKEQLNSRHCYSYLLHDYKLYKERFENMERFIEQQTKGGAK